MTPPIFSSSSSSPDSADNFKRFSASPLWRLQNAAYQTFGVEAWTEKGVPFYLTSSPYTAYRYALLAIAYLKDCLKPGAVTPIDPNAPFYIFELGAGTGRFCYLFLRYFFQMLKELCFPQLNICYVMTDIVEENIAFWGQHPYFEPYFMEGKLDSAVFYHNQTSPLRLRKAQQTLSPEQPLQNPCMVIANYFFDTIPQDYFRINHGKLEEGQVALYTTTEKGEQKELLTDKDPNKINSLHFAYRYVPMGDPFSYYPDHLSWGQILYHYMHCFPEASFLLPIGAFQTLDYFQKLSAERLLLLAGDQGMTHDTQILTEKEPAIALHGSFSVAVNYQAIAHYFRLQQGWSSLSPYPDYIFTVMAGVLGGSQSDYLETAFSYQHCYAVFEPKDYWRLVNHTQKEWNTPSLEQLLLLIKLGNWDPNNFNDFFEPIRASLPTASEAAKQLLVQAIDHVWENFFPISKEEGGFVLNLGVLLFDLKQYDPAIAYFKRALQVAGDFAAAYANMGACFWALGEPEKARECFEKAKALKS